ncbi:MAG: DegQ family serine endoprotease [gamma proteobacterium symbiont of Phacoides pectinatus]
MRAIKLRTAYPLFFMILLLVAGRAQAVELPDFTRLVESYSPAVVNISTKQKRDLGSRFKREFQIPDLPPNSPFNDFFEHFFGDRLGQGPGQERERDAQSLGSGFIVSADGYILTNYHVVEGADEILIRLSDHREFVAEIIGSDKRSDVAVLKIDADELPVVSIGSASDLKVGEWVLAIGSPFGFDHTVTAGIVSAKGRSLPNENYVPFIQTDVAINPGNSGGPLFDLDGRVVGINSQIYSRTGGFMGLSFAIPIEMAMNVADQLRTNGKVSRGWLGVLIQDVTRELADSFGMHHPHGALISKVLPGSPAEKAGLQAGDVILEFNGKPIYNSSMLPPLVGSSRVDRPAQLLIQRAGATQNLQVNIGELPAEETLAEGYADPARAEGDQLGLVVSDLTPQLREQLGLAADVSGVAVDEVRPGAASAAGVRSGDVIQMINNRPISNAGDFEQQVAALAPGKTTAILVLRQAGPIFLALRVPE